MEVEKATANGAEEPNRRRSGRAIRKPDLFAEEHNDGSNSSAKRKRVSTAKAGASGDGDQSSDDGSEDEQSEGEPDEEEIREKRKVRTRRSAIVKPATKRTKTTNGENTTLTIRPAKKSSKLQKGTSRPSQVHRRGLYADVFGHNNNADDSARIWQSALQKDSVTAIRDLVNVVLECVGCDVRIESNDVEDIDNVPNKLGDVLEEYAQNKSAEYPLISKAKQFEGFREALVAFFKAIIHGLHNSSVLYEQPEVYDNIHIWVATMSGASYRPFRHTATVISLSMTTTLCEVAQRIQKSLSDQKSQVETAKKQKNKGRTSDIQKDIKSDEKKLEVIEAQLQDAFDTVYVHRYRDVDEKVRAECVAALGRWIDLHRAMFLEGQYLRYLGWVMSDVNGSVRLEVIKQIELLFKDKRNVAALRAFTDRFRPRMVEMGARDADASVRVVSIELLDKLRNYELLEPDDIDTVGRLIFDAEPRVRKAVAKFFVSNITDLYKVSVDDMEQEQFETVLPKKNDDYMAPMQSWIKFKCLAQTIGSYDRDAESTNGVDNATGVFRGQETESRYMLATEAIFPHMPEMRDWESLAGYLLYDHSSITAEADDADVALAVQGAYKLVSGEEVVLLDVLYYSVKLYLQSLLQLQPEKKGRKGRLTDEDVKKKQETAAHNLTVIVPQLLNRYSSTPRATTSILRLEQLLNADLITDLQSGEGTYSALLDDINKQFVSHSDRKVLAEASKALRTARTFDQSKEAADAKVREIWSDATITLHNLLKGKNIDTRGTLERSVLNEVVNTTARLANLASVSDCTDMLEAKLVGKKQRGKAARQETMLDLSMELVKRGVLDEDTTAHFAEMEDQVCVAAVTVLSFYFRWKVVGLKNAIDTNDTRLLSTGSLIDLAMQRSSFVEALDPVIEARLPLDPVRVNSILTLLDLFTLFATVRHMRPAKGSLDEDIGANLTSLTIEIPAELLKEIMSTHEKMEKSLAKKSNCKIETAVDVKQRKGNDEPEENDDDIEKPPEDSDEDQASDSDADVGEDEVGFQGGRNAKKQAALLAEQQLCELTSKIVLAIIAGVVDEKVKERLRINRSKLGKSYGQVIAYLDDKSEKKVRGGQSKELEITPKGKKQQQQAEKVRQKAVERMEIDGDPIEDEDNERDEEVDENLEDGAEEGAGDGDADTDDDAAAAEVDDEILGD